MNTNYLKIAIMAAVADGTIQPQESEMLSQMRSSHPLLRSISDKEAQQSTVDVYNKLSAGMDTRSIVDAIGKELTPEQREAAYAIAHEICAADFEVFPSESEFVRLLEKQWKVKASTKKAIEISIKLRYFTD